MEGISSSANAGREAAAAVAIPAILLGRELFEGDDLERNVRVWKRGLAFGVVKADARVRRKARERMERMEVLVVVIL